MEKFEVLGIEILDVDDVLFVFGVETLVDTEELFGFEFLFGYFLEFQSLW